mgnify:CR=1 FL=1
MQQHSNTLLYVAAGIFIFMLIMTIFLPTISNVSNNETSRLETITNGGDVTPPAGWTP